MGGFLGGEINLSSSGLVLYITCVLFMLVFIYDLWRVEAPDVGCCFF